MKNIIHFDYQPGIDDAFLNEQHCYKNISFNQGYTDIDPTIEIITGMHNSVFNAYTLEIFPNLKAIVTRTVGTNHIDTDFFSSKGVEVFAVGQYGPQVIATHALAIFLAGARDLIRTHDSIDKYGYEYSHIAPIDIEGKTAGIIGLGNIGKRIAKYLRAFGMQILAFDIYQDAVFAQENQVQYTDLGTLYKESDAIFLACNLTDSNKEMIDLSAIGEMKENIILINIARGELIDEDALIKNVSKFRFIGLDVIGDETREGLKKFEKYENIYITPHVAHLSDTTVRIRWEKTYSIINTI